MLYAGQSPVRVETKRLLCFGSIHDWPDGGSLRNWVFPVQECFMCGRHEVTEYQEEGQVWRCRNCEQPADNSRTGFRMRYWDDPELCHICGKEQKRALERQEWCEMNDYDPDSISW